MNKKDIINKLVEQTHLNKSDVRDIVEGTFTLIAKELTKGNPVRIVGFGVFEVRRRIARSGRNPQTGETLKIPATKTPSFLAGKALKDAIKGRNGK